MSNHYPNEPLVSFTVKVNGLRTRVVLKYVENIKCLIKTLVNKNRTFKYRVINRAELVDWHRDYDERLRARQWLRANINITHNRPWNGKTPIFPNA